MEEYICTIATGEPCMMRCVVIRRWMMDEKGGVAYDL